jgi:hypothetical protein
MPKLLDGQLLTCSTRLHQAFSYQVLEHRSLYPLWQVFSTYPADKWFPGTCGFVSTDTRDIVGVLSAEARAVVHVHRTVLLHNVAELSAQGHLRVKAALKLQRWFIRVSQLLHKVGGPEKSL